MPLERTLTREDVVRLLERACDLDEARIIRSACAMAEAELAGSSIVVRPGAAGRALDHLDEERQRRIVQWMGSWSRLRNVVQSNIPLRADARGRLAELLEEMGGAPLGSAREELARETDDGVRVTVRTDLRGTEITVTSDHRVDVVGAAIGTTALSAVGATLMVKTLGLASGPEVLGAAAAGLAAGYLSLRMYLETAQARWLRRLHEVGAAVDALVTRAATIRPESEG